MMSRKDYFRRWVTLVVVPAFGQTRAWIGNIGILASLLFMVLPIPWLQSNWQFITKVLMAAVFFSSLIRRIFSASYQMHRETEAELEKLRAQQETEEGRQRIKDCLGMHLKTASDLLEKGLKLSTHDAYPAWIASVNTWMDESKVEITEMLSPHDVAMMFRMGTLPNHFPDGINHEHTEMRKQLFYCVNNLGEMFRRYGH
jgi:uncharacterized membrane-anchored protein YhcB (DUF1043 family)